MKNISIILAYRIFFGFGVSTYAEENIHNQFRTTQDASSYVDEKGRSEDDYSRDAQAHRRLFQENKKREDLARQVFSKLAEVAGEADECLAIKINRGDCIATVESFNATLASHYSKHLGAQSRDSLARLASSARVEVMAEFNTRAFLKEKLEMSGRMEGLSDSIRREIEVVNENGFDSNSESRLQMLYKIYRMPLILHLEKTRLDVFASTDSTFLNCFRQSLVRGAGLPTDSVFNHWVPSLALLSEMPKEVVEAIDSVRNGNWIGPLQCSFGALLVRWRVKGTRKSVTFKNMRPYLIALDYSRSHTKDFRKAGLISKAGIAEGASFIRHFSK